MGKRMLYREKEEEEEAERAENDLFIDEPNEARGKKG